MSQIIIYPTDTGVATVLPTLEALNIMTIEQIAQKDVPQGKEYKIIDSNFLPNDYFCFRDAWTYGDIVNVNLVNAKLITTSKMRYVRELEFKPYDEIIALQIPGEDSQAAETERVLIRQKYDVIQTDIDGCANVSDLQLIYDSL
jgi:hypothetical protein